MKKYNFKELLNELPKKERDQAMEELPIEMKMGQQHFQYNVLNAKWPNGKGLLDWKLILAKQYLVKNFPKYFKNLKTWDLINEPPEEMLHQLKQKLSIPTAA